MNAGHLPTGSMGFDCNTTVTLANAKKFYAHGYRFAVRYVRRAASHTFDIKGAEMVALLEAGLAVMLVQHVAPPGWKPSKVIGRAYGAIAADHAQGVGYAPGSTLWCDLEGVSSSSSPVDVIGFCNAWYDQALAAGYVPGLYVGDSPGLTALQLYHSLKFKAYWRAYNLNADLVPAVRGVQMKQRAYPKPGARVPGIPFEYDTNEILRDALGGTPILTLPPFDL